MEPQKDPNPNYLPYPPNPQQGGDEIDLRELFKALWKGKWIIIATTFIKTTKLSAITHLFRKRLARSCGSSSNR
ncbi:Wzz/FepE/Etk N-terminal domain-containing protein, partial [Vibrio parahaemolyticus]|uniref:Wzz/FepE/Etk N-terminal domain-containing protein n=1 Tax=Vibrio parahaemolyticus TaxID=670 RepID=UPI0032AE9113